MFDYVNRKTDPKQLFFYIGGVLFGIPWIIHSSLWTGFLLEAYVITVAVFVFDPFDSREKDVKQKWFWSVMFKYGAIVHPLSLAGLLLLDAAYPTFVTGTGTIFLMAIMVSAVESVILSHIVDRVQLTSK